MSIKMRQKKTNNSFAVKEVKKPPYVYISHSIAGFSKFIPISLNPYNMGGTEVKNHIA